jgi:hypothetical protein
MSPSQIAFWIITGIFLPLGLYLIFSRSDRDWLWGSILTAIGSIALVFAIRGLLREESRPPETPPVLVGIRFTQSRVESTDPSVPYALRVTIQTDKPIQPTALAIECDAPISVGGYQESGGGAFMKSEMGVVRSNPTIYFLEFGFPPFEPENPIIVTLMSRTALTVKKVELVPYRFP